MRILDFPQCPACGSRTFRTFDLGAGNVLRRCDACGTVSALDYADPSEVYVDGYMFGEAGPFGLDVTAPLFQQYLFRVADRRVAMIEAGERCPGRAPARRRLWNGRGTRRRTRAWVDDARRRARADGRRDGPLAGIGRDDLAARAVWAAGEQLRRRHGVSRARAPAGQPRVPAQPRALGASRRLRRGRGAQLRQRSTAPPRPAVGRDYARASTSSTSPHRRSRTRWSGPGSSR